LNFAFEIVGLFLFIGGMAYLLLSGRIANMFRDRAPKPLLLIALITACAVYHWVTILSEPVPAAEPPSAPPSAAVPIPHAPAPMIVRRPVRAAKPAPALAPTPHPPAATEHWETIIVEEAAPQQVFAPQATDPVPASQAPSARSGPDPYESKAKRGIKALGRFLHLRKATQ
jgi:hypothetical protein